MVISWCNRGRGIYNRDAPLAENSVIESYRGSWFGTLLASSIEGNKDYTKRMLDESSSWVKERLTIRYDCLRAIRLDTRLAFINCVAEHGFVISVTVIILFSIVGFGDALLQSIPNGATSFRCDTRAGTDAGCIWVAKDTVVERVTHIV